MIQSFKYFSKALLIAMPLLFMSCSSIKENKENQIVIQLKKTACYGQCPVYVFTIYEDGTCFINPKQFLAVKTFSKSFVPKTELEDLIQQAKTIDFWELDEEYNNKKVSDLPSAYITVNRKRQTKTIHSRIGSPKNLVEFIKNVEKIAISRDWKTVKNQP